MLMFFKADLVVNFFQVFQSLSIILLAIDLVSVVNIEKDSWHQNFSETAVWLIYSGDIMWPLT
jgi:hypothetical protein